MEQPSASRVAHYIKILATKSWKPDEVSSIPGAHVKLKERADSTELSSDLHMHGVVHAPNTPPYKHTHNTHNNNNDKLRINKQP